MKTTKLTGLVFVFFMASLKCSAVGVLLGPIPHNGHDYYLLGQSAWPEANAQAATMGGYLAAVGDQAENDWIWNTFSGGSARSLWIGFTDEAVEGAFVWTSGDPVTYNNWEPVNPSNSGGVEHYTEMRWGVQYDSSVGPGSWNDMPGNVDYWDNRPIQGVVEVVPEAETIALACLAIAGLLRRQRGNA